MKVLVLAAGKSKRIKPIKDKNFLNFLGKPLIQHQLELLAGAGFDEIILVGGEHNLANLKKLGDSLDLKIDYVEQTDFSQGMSAAVLAAKDAIGKDGVLIFSSNDVVEGRAFELVKEAADRGDAESYILGKKVDRYFPGGYLEVDEKGLISGIVEKPGAGKEPSDMVNLVVHLHKNAARLIKELEEVGSDQDDHYEVAMDNLMKKGAKMQAVEYEGFWQPVKFPWHVHEVFKYLISQVEGYRAEGAMVSEKAVVNGKVIMEEGVKIFDGAVVNGPVYLGRGTIVATGSLVREAHVGEGCVIGFSTEVARSYLGNEVWTHSNYIGDSVIGNNVGFGAGMVTGNFRLDEGNVMYAYGDDKIDTQTAKFGLITGDNVRIGVNTSTMPGVKIGDGSFVGAGIVIGEDVPAGSFVRGKWELKISENKANIEGKNRDEYKKKI